MKLPGPLRLGQVMLFGKRPAEENRRSLMCSINYASVWSPFHDYVNKKSVRINKREVQVKHKIYVHKKKPKYAAQDDRKGEMLQEMIK